LSSSIIVFSITRRIQLAQHSTFNIEINIRKYYK
jgi:hypothetical protein